MSIEEIKKIFIGRGFLTYTEIQTLFAFLEKEKEKVEFSKTCYEEEVEHSKKAEKCLEAERKSVNELSLALQKAEERVRELETTLASIKADTSIGKLIVEDNHNLDDNDWG